MSAPRHSIPPLLPAVRTLPPANTSQRIGLFGGSFNPPHSGHLHVAETALKRLGLDWIYWLPALGNPLKAEPAHFHDRLHAVRLLIGHNPRMAVSDFEQVSGLRYSADVLAALQARFPAARFVWLMGADSLVNFHHWKDWRRIAGSVPLCVVSRPGTGQRALASPFAHCYAASRLPEHAAGRLPFTRPPAWVFLKAPHDPTSSTQLRRSGRKR